MPVYPDEKLCGIWAQVTGDGRRTGRNIACADAWIAATAIALGCPLLTHNPSDFRGVAGLTVVSSSHPTRPPSGDD